MLPHHMHREENRQDNHGDDDNGADDLEEGPNSHDKAGSEQIFSLQVKGINLMGLHDHLERELHQCDFPRIIDPFEDGEHGIARFSNIAEQPLADLFHGLVNDLLFHLGTAETKSVLKKRKIHPLIAHVFEQSIKPLARLLIKAFHFHIGIWANKQRPRGFHFTRADSHLAGFVHQFADQLEFETCLTKRSDSTVWLVNNPAGFHGVVEVVRADVHAADRLAGIRENAND